MSGLLRVAARAGAILSSSDKHSVVMHGKWLLTLFLACGSAQASEWVSIGKSDDGVREHFADVSIIGITRETRRA
jgi:hypothetical protein